MKPEHLCELRERVAHGLAEGVRVGIGPWLGLGVFTVDGRQAGIRIDATATDMLRVSDGGETWAGLWSDGSVNAAPSASLRSKIEDVCRAFRLEWNAGKNEIVTFAKPAELSDVAMRIAAASIAIDSWRPWLRASVADRSPAGFVPDKDPTP